MTSGGYVGLSIAVLLSQHHHVTAVDIVPEKVELINQKKSPIQDDYIEKYLAEKDLDLTATLDGETAYREADFVIIAAPTNYDSRKNFFDTSAVEAVIRLVKDTASTMRPTMAGLAKLRPMPPNSSLTMTMDTKAPTTGIHRGMVEGTLKASSSPVTTADRSWMESG